MRRNVERALSVVLAVTLVATAMGGAVSMGMVDREQVDPTGDAQAIACGGLCIAGVAGAAAIAGGAIGAKYFASDVNTTALAGADAQETKTNIYQQGTTQAQNNAILKDSLNNYLQDTRSIARMEAKTAYIRALENGSSEATARAKATQAVDDYYAAKQLQLIASFETNVQTIFNLQQAVSDDSGVSSGFVGSGDGAASSYTPVSSTSDIDLTLANGSTVTVTQFDVSGDDIDPTSTSTPNGHTAVYVAAPTDSYSAEPILTWGDYGTLWSEIETQNSNVNSDVDTFVTNTYSNYQQGDISTDDLVDPYLEAREYSPDANYETWSLRSLTSMGLNPPENLSNTGYMEVENHATGETVEGVLLSDGVPTSGGFDIGTRYSSANLTGPQYVVNENGTVDLTGEFTVTNATAPDGETLNKTSVSYNEITYDSTNIEEFKAQMEQLQNLTASIESRQQRLRSGGGGGLFAGIGGSLGFGFNDTQAAAAVIGLVFAVLVAAAMVSRIFTP